MDQELICTPFGVCEPCPADQLDKPFCQPFGNRRLMHCQNATSSPHRPKPHHKFRRIPPPQQQYQGDLNPFPVASDESSQRPPLPPPSTIGETPAWESCGRIVSQERADFYEFVACNLLFAIGAILVVYIRSRRRHVMQARQLAARIGLIRNSGG
ncbi:hypothetical protein D9757_003880 [Collybiopsis confluens]|uniref:Uncharacterized protein n=1 Tax=Collybiopsis confluens TaxID=2823264 RepID=A0A8H5HV71_9AGAR|nr:hypothetical protein D9757_003880 [Collybiopsis confluens]